MTGDVLGFASGENATGIWWAEAWDADKHPTMNTTPHLQQKNYPVQNVNGATTEKAILEKTHPTC